MTAASGATDRPFTVVVCTACAGDDAASLIDELRPTVRRCPHAMLVSAGCVCVSLTCASRPAGSGLMAVLQPCTADRVACGSAQWIGPIADDADAAALREWLELGEWENTPLPRQLAAYQRWVHRANRSN